MHKVLTLVTVGLLTLGLSGCASLTGPKQSKVVYHVNGDDPKDLNAAMRNVQNHINAVCGKGATAESCKEKLDLRVVMHGKGVALLQKANTDPDMQQKVISLKKQGIAFNICANTLKGKNINYKNDLFDVSEKDIVPSGVAELCKLQDEGFRYVKP